VGVAERRAGAEAPSRSGNEDLSHGQLLSISRTDERGEHAQGYVSGKRVIRLRKRPGSDRVGYGLNVPRTPRRRKHAYKGSCLVRA
jgi:hypothetical protein